MTPLLWWIACTPAPDDPTDTRDKDSADTAETGETGDTGTPDIVATEVTVTLGEIPTAAWVRWSTAVETEGAVEVGGRRFEGTSGTEHALVVLLDPGVEQTVQILAGDAEIGAETVTAGTLPEGVDGLDLDTGLVDAGLLYTEVDAGRDVVSYVTVVGPDGNALWGFAEADVLAFYSGLRPGGIWVMASQAPDGPDPHILEVDWDGTRRIIDAPGFHHDLRWIDGAYLGTQSEFGERNGTTVMGDALVQIEADGSTTTLWSAIEDLPPGDPPTDFDWTHANGLDVAADGRVAISLFGTEQVVVYDGDTTVLEGGFGPQHAPRFVDAGIWIFDNGVSPAASAAVLLDDDGVERERWPIPDGARTEFMGEVRPVAGGLLMSTAYDQRVFRFDDTGQVVASGARVDPPDVGFIGGLTAFSWGEVGG